MSHRLLWPPSIGLLCGCVSTQGDLDHVNLQISAVVAIATGVSTIFSVAIMVWRNFTRRKELTNLACGVAGAIASSRKRKKVNEVDAILTEGLPGTAAVTPIKVAELTVDAQRAILATDTGDPPIGAAVRDTALGDAATHGP